MPKSRKAKTENCDFCGFHMNDVPLLVVSSTTGAAVCSFCAMGVMEQTFRAGMRMEEKIRELTAPKETPEEATPKIEIVGKVDKVDVAVAKALKHGIK